MTTPNPINAPRPSAVAHDAVIAPIDIVILSNGPGEVATWVKPVVRELVDQASTSLSEGSLAPRISVILSPCPHASGQEHTTARAYDEVDRVQSAPHFFNFLLTGKTADDWDWHPNGVVVFLGGDQLYTVLIAKRLGYRSVTYAEIDARWPSLIDRFGVMQSAMLTKAPTQHQPKFTVVGDLMADVKAESDRTAITTALQCEPGHELIGLLPGSKPVKLTMALPLLLAAIQRLHSHRPQTRYVIGVAPNLPLSELLRYADPATNPGVNKVNSPTVQLFEPENGLPYLQFKDDPLGDNGAKVFLWQRFPALDLFSQCTLCITTPGANTAQLGALAVPMIVLTSIEGLDALKLADGLPGLIARLPGVGAIASNLISPLIIRALQKSGKLFAWPNIWAKRKVVPEYFGIITPEDVETVVLDHLTHPEKLDHMRQDLQSLRGASGAAEKMATLILETVHYPK